VSVIDRPMRNSDLSCDVPVNTEDASVFKGSES